MFQDDLIREAASLIAACRSRTFRISTAESCTGGLIAALLTEIAGSSDVFERGFVTYSNGAKTQMLGVPADLIESHGAVSQSVARAMAEGALAHSPAEIAVAVTGIAGPGGGTAAKPVGLVHLAVARRSLDTVHRRCEFGSAGRSAIREATVRAALEMLRTAAGRA